MTPEELRDGLFNLKNRQFEAAAEIMVQKLGSLNKAKNIFHDFFDAEGKQRVEVKFSTVRKKHISPITTTNILLCIQHELSKNRQVNFLQVTQDIEDKIEFDCNIQQIKRNEFETLYYGLFFYDKIVIFKINFNSIEAADIGYSDHQNQADLGEGQFHINQKNLQKHIDQYSFKEMEYDELLDLLS